jgi:outer membrane PBP1 activator LpoA protein
MPSVTRHCLRLLVVAWCLALLCSCATVETAPSPQEQAAIDHAGTLYRQGDFDGAAQAYVALAQQSRGGRDDYLLHAIESYRQEGAWDKAAPLFDDITRRHLEGDQAQHYDVLAAEAAQARGDHAAALALTEHADTLAPAYLPRALETRARAQAASGAPFDAARTRLALDRHLQGFDRSENQHQLLALLGKQDAAALQAEAHGLSDKDALKPWIAQALSAQGGALAMTLPQLDSQVGTLVPGSGSSVSREGYHPPHHVGLLLPASGPLAPAAAAVHDGFFTAYKADPASASMHVDVYDSGDGDAGAQAAYQKAVGDGVDMVVGPLAPDAVGAMFQRGNLPVRMLALNHPDNGLPPSGSAEFSLPPEAEAAQVAAHMRTLGLGNAVMFVADSSWADRAARAFRAQFESNGGHVLASATLASDQVNYAGAIATVLAGAGTDTGIFIALGPEQGRLLVPQLRIAHVQQPLFATSHIYAAEEDPGLDRDLDGVIFCDAPWLFDAQPGLPKRADIARDQPTANGVAARLFAFGMDAYALLPYLDWLRAHPHSYLPGATGQLTLDSFGRVLRTPIWVQFVNGIATPSSGGLSVSTPSP